MGSGSSTAATHKDLGKSQQAIVKLMMPLYYDPSPISPEEHKIAEHWWQMILTDKTPEYLAKKGTPGFNYESCVTFFYDNFYCRLFDIHPMARDLFKSGMAGQGKFLVMMLSLALSELEKPGQFDNLLKLAEVHYKRGVKAVEYGIVGDVLFWTLRKVIGDDHYTSEVHSIWVKIYCRMLKTIVPCAVAHEIEGAGRGQSAHRDTTTSLLNTDINSKTTTTLQCGEVHQAAQLLSKLVDHNMHSGGCPHHHEEEAKESSVSLCTRPATKLSKCSL